MTKSAPTPSSFLAWLEAGAELLSAQLAQITDSVHKELTSSHQLVEELQRRGEEIDEQLRNSLTPSGAVSTVQQILLNNPVYRLLAANAKADHRREQQLDLLSVKVDLLIEQVALLSAKQNTAEKKGSKSKSPSAGETGSKNNDVADGIAPVSEENRKATHRRKPVASNRATRTSVKTDPKGH